MSKGNFIKGIRRLFNIDVREVSIVDHPAINESFTEVKRKDGLGNVTKEEKVMDEKKVTELIQSALAPLADGIKTIETRLEAQEKVVAETGKKMEEFVAGNAEGAKNSEATITELREEVKTIVEDSIKRFERIEGLVTRASSQKIAGQDDDGDDKKAQPKWPSLTGAKA